jgi:hypothetical protein
LKPLRASQRSAQAADAGIEERLRSAWSLVVGLALSKRTRLVRVRRGILVVGAWDLARIQALRAAAAAAWPEVRARVRRFTGIDLAGLEVEPCDAPPADPVPAGPSPDPLAALLGALKGSASRP